jgi:Na+-translocating ferredoxin:NAD+ oxidoreductase RnfC subunit
MNPKPHAMHDGRRVPIKTLAKKLHVLDYDLPAPYLDREITPQRVTLPLKQSAGTAALAKVGLGDRVQAGSVIAEPAPNVLGAVLHAPFAGVICAVTDKHIVLEK